MCRCFAAWGGRWRNGLDGADLVENALRFETRAKWKQWLKKNHATSSGEWIAIGKKACQRPCLRYDDALEVALCYGWIDAKVMKGDDEVYVQRFLPRTKRSIWSKLNCERVERLIEAGQMEAAGLAEIERAKSDGRWAAAYEPASRAQVPDDLQAALDANPKAKKFFATVSAQNRYAILLRIHMAAKPEARKRKIDQFVEMLAAGRAPYPA